MFGSYSLSLLSITLFCTPFLFFQKKIIKKNTFFSLFFLFIFLGNYSYGIYKLNISKYDFEKRRSGFIVGISSVAGDRGRKSNYVYGAAKAALTAYLSGLRNRLYGAQVHVLTVKPGFVATKMTEKLDLPGKLTTQPEEVAEDIYRAQQNGKNVLYTKWIWRWVMLIIKIIPEWKFKGMNL